MPPPVSVSSPLPTTTVLIGIHFCATRAIVSVLAKVSERRQVIVATHNANIPVLGDAELVVALDASSESARVLEAGGLENPQVAKLARRILEGGDEAFRARHKRYLASV